jgi:hypothetical protein
MTLAIAAAIVVASSPLLHMTTAQQPPEALLDNGQIKARVYVPDARTGFYRSTRFDWSGVIGSLEYQGHNFYGPWFTKRDPSVRDFIYKDSDIVVSDQSGVTGPAEEFRTPQGYTTAKAGETFVKIGVGVLRKPDDARYSGYANYPIVDAGKWTVRTTATSIETTQEVNDPVSGYGYVYRKVVRLTPGKPEMVIEHNIRNIGRLPIQTRQYNHNFLVLDKTPTGPDFVIKLPFEIKADQPPAAGAAAAVEGSRIVYKRRLNSEESFSLGVLGFGAEPKDYDVRVENPSVGAGVRITSDRPVAAMSLWSIRSNISFEPDVDVNVAAGASMNWTYTYTFYTLSK